MAAHRSSQAPHLLEPGAVAQSGSEFPVPTGDVSEATARSRPPFEGEVLSVFPPHLIPRLYAEGLGTRSR